MAKYPAQQAKRFVDLGGVNWEDMNQYFYSYNFTQYFNSVDTEFIWDQLKRVIYNALNRYIPAVTIKTAKWFAPPTRHKVKCLCTLKKDACSTHD